jgi:MoaA/NifB/PqqE/SkfB family radical SAM enzyme
MLHLFKRPAPSTAGSRIALQRPFRSAGGHGWTARVGNQAGAGDSPQHPYGSRALLLEDGAPLYGAHAAHYQVRGLGRGLYSHWESELLFSTSDNSDPNRNGRRYEIEACLDLEQWERARTQAATQLWQLHPDAHYFYSRGGQDIAPPVFCNLGITNKCNLRCEICGSQKFLDEANVLRRHMRLEVFRGVAQTLFPLMAEVELNSQGDPFLHPHITHILQTVAQHDCDLKVQTNGTLFSDEVIEALRPVSATVMLSLDAVGPKFDEVRRGGSWSKLEPQLTRFLRERDARRQRVGIYPTLTRRTLPQALRIADWALEHGIEEVSYHRYSPIQNSFEETPAQDELQGFKDQLRAWLSRHDGRIAIALDGIHLNEQLPGDRRSQIAGVRKRAVAPLFCVGNIFPMEATESGSDPGHVCPAPLRYVEIGLDGQIAACCRAQDVALGYATSVEQFADAWLGDNYRKIRRSLRRDAEGNLPLPNCESCIQFHAPRALNGRRAVRYDQPPFDLPDQLSFAELSEVRLEAIQRERGHCYISRIPPGIDPHDFEAWEDEQRLAPGMQRHDDIRALGQGRYSIWGRQVYFSASDNTDPRTNKRAYRLTRVTSHHDPAPTIAPIKRPAP